MNPEPPPLADPRATETRPTREKRESETMQQAASSLGAAVLMLFWTFCCVYSLWEKGALHWPLQGENIVLAAFGLFFGTFGVLVLASAILLWILGDD